VATGARLALQPEPTRQFAFLAPCILVALFAVERLVPAQERKRGQGVIEPVLVEAGDVRFLAQMLCMAPAALGILQATVKPALAV